MPAMTCKTPTRTTRAVKLLNAVCPRCDGPIYSCPDRWLFCKTCTKPTIPFSIARPIPFTLAIPTEAAA